MKELTKAEEQVMQYLWKIKKGFLKDIVEQYPDPKPANTTISTVIRVLVKKGYIDYNTYGKSNEYFAIISKKKYTKTFFNGYIKKFFNNSASNLFSFFAKENNMSLQELEELKLEIEKQIEKKQQA